MQKLNELGAREAAKRLAAREITAEALARACLERIKEREPTVGAWIHIDPDAAIAQAKKLDAGPVRGPLHGLPLGVKDIIDTADMPTGYGAAVYAGKRPAFDAAGVALARAAGALILGKTVSTEFAWFHPGKTANPRNPQHTPGGSSSGSAAAVADCMAPLAFGTQTAGSIVRPGGYCGIVGYKPSYGTLRALGVKMLGESLDTLGVMARSPGDAALLVGALSGRDLLASPLASAPQHRALPHARMARRAAGNQAGAGARAKRGAPGRRKSDRSSTCRRNSPACCRRRSTCMNYESYRSLSSDRVHHWDGTERHAAETARCGRQGRCRALRRGARARRRLPRNAGRVFADADVILAPSAPGEAPRGLGATGDPIFCRIWTLLGVPAMSIPCSKGPNGCP
jgi:amidase